MLGDRFVRSGTKIDEDENRKTPKIETRTVGFYFGVGALCTTQCRDYNAGLTAPLECIGKD